jgi:FKBP-type peptidyl-prolyl cis-trans isomerase FklB
MRWLALWGIGLLTLQVTVGQTPSLKTDKEKLSYAMGMDLGRQLRLQSVDIEPELFRQGLRDALSGGKTLLTEEEVRAAIAGLQAGLQKKQAALQNEQKLAMKALAEKNQKEGEAFLAQNKTKEGVVTLPSGLQYKILRAGDGKKPSLSDTVVCHYRATTLDGKEVDSSYKRDKPQAVPVTDFNKGWTEALVLMPVGSKWQLFIPPGLAYGAQGASGVVGPNATLIFELELLSIQSKP